MKRKLLGLVILALLLFVPLMGHAATAGKFTAVEGRVDVTSPGKEAHPAKLGDLLNVGDIIRTKSKSKCEVAFPDGSILRLAENSRLRVNEFSQEQGQRNATLDLFRGKIQNVVTAVAGAASGGSKYEVRTPTAVCGVRGTFFFVYHQAGVTGAAFKEGTGYGYSLNRPQDVRTIRPGQAMIVSSPNLPPVIRPATDTEMHQHQRDTTPSEKPKSEGKEDDSKPGEGTGGGSTSGSGDGQQGGGTGETGGTAGTGGDSGTGGSGGDAGPGDLVGQTIETPTDADLSLLPGGTGSSPAGPSGPVTDPTPPAPILEPVVVPPDQTATTDRTPPEITIIPKASPVADGKTIIKIDLAANESVDFSTSLDGGPAVAGASVDFDTLAAGSHTVIVTATDIAGNKKTETLTFDLNHYALTGDFYGCIGGVYGTVSGQLDGVSGQNWGAWDLDLNGAGNPTPNATWTLSAGGGNADDGYWMSIAPGSTNFTDEKLSGTSHLRYLSETRLGYGTGKVEGTFDGSGGYTLTDIGAGYTEKPLTFSSYADSGLTGGLSDTTLFHEGDYQYSDESTSWSSSYSYYETPQFRNGRFYLGSRSYYKEAGETPVKYETSYYSDGTTETRNWTWDGATSTWTEDSAIVSGAWDADDYITLLTAPVDPDNVSNGPNDSSSSVVSYGAGLNGLLGGSDSLWSATGQTPAPFLFMGNYSGSWNAPGQIWQTTIASKNPANGSYTTYDGGAFWGYLAGIDLPPTADPGPRGLEGLAAALYIDSAGNAGYLAGSLSGPAYPEIGMFQMDGSLVPHEMSNVGITADGLADAIWSWSSPAHGYGAAAAGSGGAASASGLLTGVGSLASGDGDYGMMSTAVYRDYRNGVFAGSFDGSGYIGPSTSAVVSGNALNDMATASIVNFDTSAVSPWGIYKLTTAGSFANPDSGETWSGRIGGDAVFGAAKAYMITEGGVQYPAGSGYSFEYGFANDKTGYSYYYDPNRSVDTYYYADGTTRVYVYTDGQGSTETVGAWDTTKSLADIVPLPPSDPSRPVPTGSSAATWPAGDDDYGFWLATVGDGSWTGNRIGGTLSGRFLTLTKMGTIGGDLLGTYNDADGTWQGVSAGSWNGGTPLAFGAEGSGSLAYNGAGGMTYAGGTDGLIGVTDLPWEGSKNALAMGIYDRQQPLSGGYLWNMLNSSSSRPSSDAGLRSFTTGIWSNGAIDGYTVGIYKTADGKAGFLQGPLAGYYYDDLGMWEAEGSLTKTQMAEAANASPVSGVTVAGVDFGINYGTLRLSGAFNGDASAQGSISGDGAMLTSFLYLSLLKADPNTPGQTIELPPLPLRWGIYDMMFTGGGFFGSGSGNAYSGRGGQGWSAKVGGIGPFTLVDAPFFYLGDITDGTWDADGNMRGTLAGVYQTLERRGSFTGPFIGLATDGEVAGAGNWIGGSVGTYVAETKLNAFGGLWGGVSNGALLGGSLYTTDDFGLMTLAGEEMGLIAGLAKPWTASAPFQAMGMYDYQDPLIGAKTHYLLNTPVSGYDRAAEATADPATVTSGYFKGISAGIWRQTVEQRPVLDAAGAPVLDEANNPVTGPVAVSGSLGGSIRALSVAPESTDGNGVRTRTLGVLTSDDVAGTLYPGVGIWTAQGNLKPDAAMAMTVADTAEAPATISMADSSSAFYGDTALFGKFDTEGAANEISGHGSLTTRFFTISDPDGSIYSPGWGIYDLMLPAPGATSGLFSGKPAAGGGWSAFTGGTGQFGVENYGAGYWLATVKGDWSAAGEATGTLGAMAGDAATFGRYITPTWIGSIGGSLYGIEGAAGAWQAASVGTWSGEPLSHVSNTDYAGLIAQTRHIAGNYSYPDGFYNYSYYADNRYGSVSYYRADPGVTSYEVQYNGDGTFTKTTYIYDAASGYTQTGTETGAWSTAEGLAFIAAPEGTGATLAYSENVRYSENEGYINGLMGGADTIWTATAENPARIAMMGEYVASGNAPHMWGGGFDYAGAYGHGPYSTGSHFGGSYNFKDGSATTYDGGAYAGYLAGTEIGGLMDARAIALYIDPSGDAGYLKFRLDGKTYPDVGMFAMDGSIYPTLMASNPGVAPGALRESIQEMMSYDGYMLAGTLEGGGKIASDYGPVSMGPGFQTLSLVNYDANRAEQWGIYSLNMGGSYEPPTSASATWTAKAGGEGYFGAHGVANQYTGSYSYGDGGSYSYEYLTDNRSGSVAYRRADPAITSYDVNYAADGTFTKTTYSYDPSLESYSVTGTEPGIWTPASGLSFVKTAPDAENASISYEIRTPLGVADRGYWIANIDGNAAENKLTGTVSGSFVTPNTMGNFSAGGGLAGDLLGTYDAAGNVWQAVALGNWEGSPTDFGGDWYHSTLYNDLGYLRVDSEGGWDNAGTFGFVKRPDGNYDFLSIGHYYLYGYAAEGFSGPYLWSGSLWYGGRPEGNRYLEGFTGGIWKTAAPDDPYGTMAGSVAAVYYTEDGKAGLIHGGLTGGFDEMGYDVDFEQAYGMWKAESGAGGLTAIDKSASLPGSFDPATAGVDMGSLYADLAGSFGGNVGTIGGVYYKGATKFITYNDIGGNRASLPFGIYNLKLGGNANFTATEALFYNHYAGKPAAGSVAWNAKVGGSGYFGGDVNGADYGYWLANIAGQWDEQGPEAGYGTITGAMGGNYLTRSHMGRIGGPFYGLYTEDVEASGAGTWAGMSVGDYEGTPLTFGGTVEGSFRSFDGSQLWWHTYTTVDGVDVKAITGLWGGTDDSWNGTPALALGSHLNSYGYNLFVANLDGSSPVGNGRTKSFAFAGGRVTQAGMAADAIGFYARENGATSEVGFLTFAPVSRDVVGLSADGSGVWQLSDNVTAFKMDDIDTTPVIGPSYFMSGYFDGIPESASYAAPIPNEYPGGDAIPIVSGFVRGNALAPDWGIWQMVAGGSHPYSDADVPATPVNTAWTIDSYVPATTGGTTVTDTTFYQVAEMVWDKTARTINGSTDMAFVNWADATTYVGGGNIKGVFDPIASTLKTWQAITTGAGIETAKFLAMANGATTTEDANAALKALNIPAVQVGKATLSQGAGTVFNNLSGVSMADVTFFANSTGGAPKIWATDNVSGSYSAAPSVTGPAVPLAGGGLTADFGIRNWNAANNTWGANVTNGTGNLSGGTYNGAVQFEGGAAGVINPGVGAAGSISGTAAGVATPPPATAP